MGRKCERTPVFLSYFTLFRAGKLKLNKNAFAVSLQCLEFGLCSCFFFNTFTKLDYLNRENSFRNSDRIRCDVDTEKTFWSNSWGRNYIQAFSVCDYQGKTFEV